MDYQKELPRFYLKNIGLSFLVSEAAIDLDNIIQGTGNEDESIMHLSKLLIEAGRENAIVLSYAISGRAEWSEYWKNKSVDEVLLQTNLAARDLRDYKTLSKQRQKELRDFCVRLSREICDFHSNNYSKQRLAA